MFGVRLGRIHDASVEAEKALSVDDIVTVPIVMTK